MNPPYLKREDVPAAVLDEEKKIILAQMAEDPKMANKPEQVKEKIAAGKVGKYYGRKLPAGTGFRQGKQRNRSELCRRRCKGSWHYNRNH